PYTSEDFGRVSGLLAGGFVGSKLFGVKAAEVEKVPENIESGKYSGDLMSAEDAATYSEHWRELGIGSDITWNEFMTANPNGTINDYFELVQNQSPWPKNYVPEHQVLSGGDRFNMVLNADAELDELGGWGLVEEVPNINFVNENMAVKSTWKTNLGKVVQCEVNDGVTLEVLKGPIGPQVDLAADKYLTGDLSLTQYDLFNGMGRIERTDYIHAIPGTDKYLH
ncbi:MAG: hypothetical protein ACERKZ_21935, partial [Lachnotalea sp.]